MALTEKATLVITPKNCSVRINDTLFSKFKDTTTEESILPEIHADAITTYLRSNRIHLQTN